MTTVSERLDHDAAATLPANAIRGRHLPALDGLRAFAVLGVMAYHLGLPAMSGGYLGVDLFFVLSGFLITTLLIEERLNRSAIALASFWGRRARRLLPAVLLMLVVVSFVTAYLRRYPQSLEVPFDLPAFRGDAIATLFYVANWHAIFAKQSYFQIFQAASPLKHTWSLAIEEQFYLVWPFVVVALLAHLRHHWRRIGITVCAGLTVASAALMAFEYHPGKDPTRVYYSTFTRLQDLTAGALLAFLIAGRPLVPAAQRRLLAWAAPVAAAVLGFAWVFGGTGGIYGLPREKMFLGGFLLCSVLATVVIADARQLEPSLLGRALGVRPLVWIGMISYGLYLWHWPIYVFCSPDRTGLSGVTLDAVKVGLTFVVATASFYLVERPLRRATYRPAWFRRSLVPLAMAATLAVILATAAWGEPSVSFPPTAPVLPLANGTIPGAGGLEGQLPIRLHHQLTPSHRLRIMVVGDSVMYAIEPALQSALRATGETRTSMGAFPGWGLSTYPNWATSLRDRVLTFHPDLVIGMWGWDNGVALQHPATYRTTLRRFVRVVTAGPQGAAGVIFLQYPKTGSLVWAHGNSLEKILGSAAGQQAFVAAAQAAQAAEPGKVMLFPTAASVLLGGKLYSSWLPPSDDRRAPRRDWVRVRSLDQVHICQPGAVRYSAAVLADLHQLFSLAPPEGPWWKGHWTKDGRYQGQLIGCPNDHPAGPLGS